MLRGEHRPRQTAAFHQRQMLAHRVQFEYICAGIQQQPGRILFVLQPHAFDRRDQQRGSAARDQADHQRLFIGGPRHVEDALRARDTGLVWHRVRGFHLLDDELIELGDELVEDIK